MARGRLLALLLAASHAAGARGCEPLAVEACRGIGYNHTGLSALAQKEAEFMLQSFGPLVQYGCSAQLRLLLCAVFAPMCTDKVAAPIGPCRGLCEGVRRRCLPVLHGFGFPWPASLNCSLFPADNNHETMCMEGPGEDDDHPPPPHADAPAPPPAPPLPPRDACPQGAAAVSSRCQPPCDADVSWSAADKRLAAAWATGWAALGFAASLGAALTLVGGGGGGGRGPAHAQTRPPPAVAFLALSHNLCAVGWAVRAAAGRRAVACGAANGLLLARDGLANANCAVVFLLLYYFGTAASVWWVVVCLSWFLTAGGGWCVERVHQQSSLFHLAGWGLPAVCTVAVLVLRHVDADELTGSCYVGNHSARALLVFVVVPQLAWLSAGCALLAAGWLASRRRAAAALRTRPLAADSKLNQGELGRLGALAVACALPTALGLLALLVEYGARRPHEADAWLAEAPPLWAPLLRLAAGQAGALAVAGWACICWPPGCRSLRAWRRLQPCKQPPPAAAAAAPAPPPPLPLYYQPAPLARPAYQPATAAHAGPLLHLQHSAAHAAALGHPHPHLHPQHQPLLLPAAHVHGGHKPARKHRSSKHAKHGSETTV